MKDKDRGFTILELIISVAILCVLTGLLTLSLLKNLRMAREEKYMVEAASVFQAVGMYLIDREAQGGTERMYRIAWDIQRHEVSSRKNVLRPYLTGHITPGAEIRSMESSDITRCFYRIEYVVDGYVIVVRSSGTVFILEYPNTDKGKR